MSDCGYQSVSYVYLGHDNAVSVVPYEDIVQRTIYDMTDVTQVTASVDPVGSLVTGDSVTASSDDVPTTIWWEQVGTEWRIHFKVGLFVGVTSGEYKLRIVLYDPPHTNGLVLTDEVLVTVVDVP
jgi:hypothetical protein